MGQPAFSHKAACPLFFQQPAGFLAVIGRGKGDVGDRLVSMDADPFVHGSAILVKFLHQQGFVGADGKGFLQQHVHLGAVLDRQFLYFHRALR